MKTLYSARWKSKAAWKYIVWSEAGTAGSTAESGSSSVPGRCSRICMRPSKNPPHAALPAPLPHPSSHNHVFDKSDILRHSTITILTALRNHITQISPRAHQIRQIFHILHQRKIVLKYLHHFLVNSSLYYFIT